MSFEKFERMMKHIFEEEAKKPTIYVMHYGCKTFGLVRLSAPDFPPICEDPECKSCRAYEDAINREADNSDLQ